MTRNLKALGLAVMAACAMSAVLASAAQAEPGTIGIDLIVDEWFLTGTQVGHHKFETGVGEVTCEDTVFHGKIKDGDHQFTLTPTYNTCTTIDPFGTKRTTTISMEGCGYLYTEGNQTGANHFKNVTVSLHCPAEKVVRIKVYNATTHGSNHEDTNRRCEYTISPFTHKGHTTVENVFPVGQAAHLTVEGEMTSIAVTRTFGSLFQCGAMSQSSDYIGHTTLKAYEDTAHTQQVSLAVTDIEG